MVCVEAELEGRRQMLDPLPRGERFGCDESDLAALHSLGWEVAGMNMLSTDAFLRWLPALRGHPRFAFGKSDRAHVLGETFRPTFTLRKVDDG